MLRRPVAQIALVAGVLALGSFLIWPGAPAAEPPGNDHRTPDMEAFVVLAGSDTVAVERFSRTADRLEGELLDLGAGDLRENYVATLSPDGLVSRFEVSVRPVNMARDTPPIRRAVITFRKDGAIEEHRANGSNKKRRLDTLPGALPYLDLSNALLEQATMRARALKAKEVALTFVNMNVGRTFTATVTQAGADSVEIRLYGVEVRARVDTEGRILGARISGRDLTVERVGVPGTQVLGAPDYTAPIGAPYVAEEVTVLADPRYSLAGTLTVPNDRLGPFPAVVLVTGSGAQERDGTYLGTYRPFRQIADVLSRRGIAVLRLDDRGVGASSGVFTRATSADFADDMRAALAYLRSRSDIDGARLALLGESEGGLIASMVAATDTDLRALVLMGTPSRTGRSLIASQVRYRLEHDGGLSLAERDSVVADVEAKNDRLARVLPWLKFILDYDPIPTAVRVATPVLILHGETDRQVPAGQAEELAVAFRGGGNQDVTVRVFPNLNHLFLEDADGDPESYAKLASKSLPSEILDEIAAWLAKHVEE